MNKPKYFLDTYLNENAAKITHIAKKDNTVLVYCDDTIFHPQGGGQPCDIGSIMIDDITYNVYHVEITKLGIAHILEPVPSLLGGVNRQCLQKIDKKHRLSNAKLHTAGHLIFHIVEEIDSSLLPTKSYHYPENAFIELRECKKTNHCFSIDHLNEKINEVVNKKPRSVQSIELTLTKVQSLRPQLSKLIPQSKQVRMIVIDGFTAVPCGGTHVVSTSELNGLRVTHIKRKKNRIKVNYSIN